MTNRGVTECHLYNLKYKLLHNTKNFVTLKPSKTITIKTYRKTLFHTKGENRKSYSHEISTLLKIVLFFRNDINLFEKITNHE
ncbi:hypothetical protein T4A_9956 [Trichinella pseudospiralis]|uniref:Uncharacterized protein n=1 Tax=Trichinella pseudospiralis TaxID=6337 RepID=A0A0V1DPY8_TRIPS|nr:hypothetical protein T4A_9956 [Trichinella pseudospiralis]